MVESVTLGIAFVGGLISFFSPCIVPIIPAYLSHLSGTTLDQLEKKRFLQKKVFINALFFVIGFSIIFILLGALFGYLSKNPSFQLWLARIGGIIIIIFGLHTLKLINIPFLSSEHRLKIGKVKTSNLGSILLGISFGIGWAPCVSPILASILVLAGTSMQVAQATYLLAIYSLGLAIPFLVVGLFTSATAKWIQHLNNKFYNVVNIVAGILLIILGIAVYTQNLQRLISLVI